MGLSLILEGHGPLLWVPAYPKGFQGPRLAGSSPYYSSGDFGSILVQEVMSEHFSIRHFIMNFFQKMQLRWKEEQKLRAQFVLQHGFTYQRDQHTIRVTPNHFNLVWAPEQIATAQFPKEKEFCFFSAAFTPAFVRQLLPAFPDPEAPPENHIYPIEPGMNDLVYNMMSNPYSGLMHYFYLENRLRDMLLSIYSRLLRKQAPGYSEEEIARIYQVDNFILRDIKVHYPIPWLARKVRMREARLKEAYKDIIGRTIYERLREARLQKARELLLATDLQVQLMFSEVGYESISGFIDAFRERFLFSPLQYRKKYGPDN